MENTKITIDDKKPYSGEAERHPYGDFYEDGVKYTCWDEKLFEEFIVGDTVNIEFTIKSNEYNGRTFTNRNISKIEKFYGENVEVIKIGDASNQVTEAVIQETINNLQNNDTPCAVSHVYTLGDLKYEVTVRALQ